VAALALLVTAVPASAETVRVKQADSGSAVVLDSGDVLQVTLQGDSPARATGFHWRTTRRPDATVLTRRSNRTVPSPGCDAPTVGCPATQVMRYRAKRAGSTSFALAYTPPGGGTPARRFRLSVRVRAARPARPPCTPAGTTTVVANRHVRVYERTSGTTKALVACHRATGRKTGLATAADDGFVTSSSYADVRLAGLFVAWSNTYVDQSCKADCPPGYESTRYSIGVFDVTRNKARSVRTRPLALVLGERGGVAWATQAADGAPVEIRASARDGDDRLLDSGAIDPRSLAIEITIASWTREGEERFARVS
jgi:predicted secreted protein